MATPAHQRQRPIQTVRHPYKECVIEVYVYNLANGLYTAQGDIGRQTSGTKMGFDTGRELPTKEAAVVAGIEVGKKRIDRDG